MNEKLKKKTNNLFNIFTNDSLKIEKSSGFEYIGKDKDIAGFHSFANNTLVLTTMNDSINFMKFIDSLMEDDFIKKNYLRKEIIDEIICYYSNTDTEVERTSRSLDNLLKVIKEVNKQEYICVIPIFGIEIQENITFNNKVTFLNYKNIDEYISTYSSDFKSIEKNFGDEYFLTENDEVAIISVKSNSKYVALELARKTIKSYLNIFRIFLGSKNGRFNLAVDKNIFSFSTSLVIGKDNIYINNKNTGAMYKVDLSHDVFSTNYVDYLLSLEDIQKIRSDVEKRLFLGSQLIGEALLENDRNTRFMKTMMAIEALIQAKGDSTTDLSFKVINLLESENNEEERKNLYKSFKDLYELRSLVAHGENSQLGLYSEYLSIDIAINLITVLIDKKFKSFEEVESFVKERQFK